ncbi:MAG: hypothetical protein ACFFB0_22325 [Promethearchaeota archaeon]
MSNMDKLDEISQMIEGLKEIKQKEKKIVPNCEFCGKSIVGSNWNKEYHHINICQEPIKRFFCSRQCKLRWIFKIL